MTISGNVSVPSVHHDQLTLSVSGTSALIYATKFASALNGANSAGTLLISDLDTPLPDPGSASGTLVEYVVSTGGETGTLPYGGTYLLDVASGGSTVTGSGDTITGDTVIGAGGGMTYLDQGGSTNVLFISGNNTYRGPGQGLTAEADTITAGSGRDTISTGSGNATVFAGTGHAGITLNDIGIGTAPGDIVVLNDGISTVNAYGVNDLINVSAPGQVINGGKSAADSDLIVIVAAATGAPGHDSVSAGAANVTVNDAAGGNTIAGGTGVLTLVAGPAPAGTRLSDTVQSSLGTVDIFASAGDAFTLTSGQVNGGANVFVAGTGAETLDGSASSGYLAIFGNDSGSAVIATGAGQTVYVGGQDTVGTSLSTVIDAGTGSVSIFGGSGDNTQITSPTDNAGILYVAGADSETIQATGAGGPVTVFGGQGGSLSIAGGGGSLLFVGGSSYAEAPSATIGAGAGGATIFGSDGDVLTLTSRVENTSVFLAGQGNESLDGSGFNGNLVAYGYNPADPIAGGNVNSSVIGGAGANYFFTGAGYETFVAGSGFNAVQIAKTVDGLGGTITIYNITSSDVIGFSGFSAADEKAAIASATKSTNGVVGTQITLSDQTTVLFVDASASDLTFKT